MAKPNDAPATPTIIRHGVTPKQLDLIEQFAADFNAIDDFLHRALPNSRWTPFKDRVRQYEAATGGWPYAAMLEQVADVRNLLAHGKTEAYEYPVVPTRQLARQLHKCADALLHPDRVADRFLREVRTVSRNDSLAGVLALVNEYKYSQFPVYDDGRCQGLLTENGITRWLAASTGSVPLVDVRAAKVGIALRKEEGIRNYRFVRPDKPVDYVRAMFVKEANLEAVLISETGTKAERPIGIVTRWEIAGLSDGR